MDAAGSSRGNFELVILNFVCAAHDEPDSGSQDIEAMVSHLIDRLLRRNGREVFCKLDRR